MGQLTRHITDLQPRNSPIVIEVLIIELQLQNFLSCS